jgi:mannose-6-phosphate isomerase
MAKPYPLIFQPIFQERIWGGRNLERLFGKNLPPGQKVGESWELVDRPEAQSVVLNGAHAGKTLRDLMKEHRVELVGQACSGERFPLLVKILDAEETLSLQVHPPPGVAAELGGEPKTEMWHLVEARPGAALYFGLRRQVTREVFEACLKTGRAADCVYRCAVHTGDSLLLPSGRLHAIGGGNVVFEIQQNSDTTYRVFDWNRVDASGRRRDLHVAESMRSIDFTDVEPEIIPARPAGPGVARQDLVAHPLFGVQRWVWPGGSVEGLTEHRAVVLGVVSGKVEVRIGPGEAVSLIPGMFCLIPAAAEAFAMNSPEDAVVLVARPGEGSA